jgi:hypothetical protein
MTLPTDTGPLGPGTLTIGETGSEIDVSCYVNNAKITADKDTADSTTKLCGDVKQGATTYSYSMSGNLDVDVANESGLFALSQDSPGSEQAYVFTPNTEAGTQASGVLIIDPLDFGGDESGETMTSDFEFTLTAKPDYAYGVVPVPDPEQSEDQTENVAA